MEGMNISIDMKMIERINKILESHKWLGFKSVEDFVLDSIRQRIEFLLSLLEL